MRPRLPRFALIRARASVSCVGKCVGVVSGGVQARLARGVVCVCAAVHGPPRTRAGPCGEGGGAKRRAPPPRCAAARTRRRPYAMAAFGTMRRRNAAASSNGVPEKQRRVAAGGGRQHHNHWQPAARAQCHLTGLLSEAKRSGTKYSRTQR
jgi:hypothetical protein